MAFESRQSSDAAHNEAPEISLSEPGIPTALVTIANVINACPDTDRRLGLPLRSWMHSKVPGVLDCRNRILRKTHPLAQHVGDLRLFSHRMWAWICYPGPAAEPGEGRYEATYNARFTVSVSDHERYTNEYILMSKETQQFRHDSNFRPPGSQSSRARDWIRFTAAAWHSRPSASNQRPEPRPAFWTDKAVGEIDIDITRACTCRGSVHVPRLPDQDLHSLSSTSLCRPHRRPTLGARIRCTHATVPVVSGCCGRGTRSALRMFRTTEQCPNLPNTPTLDALVHCRD